MKTSASGSFSHYRKTYNALSDDVEKSFARLIGRHGYTEVIDSALDAIHQREAASYCGISLLHRHFAAPANTFFLERRKTPSVAGHKTVLVTAPTSSRSLPKDFTPHRFRVDSKGKLTALEFTTDPIARQGWKALRDNRPLLKELGRRLAKNRFNGNLGIALFDRRSEVKSATRVYLEETDFEKKRSIVHILPSLPRVSGRLIPTLWTIQDAGNGCCTQVCVAYCEHPKGGLRIGYCGHRNEGHIGCA